MLHESCYSYFNSEDYRSIYQHGSGHSTRPGVQSEVVEAWMRESVEALRRVPDGAGSRPPTLPRGPGRQHFTLHEVRFRGCKRNTVADGCEVSTSDPWWRHPRCSAHLHLESVLAADADSRRELRLSRFRLPAERADGPLDRPGDCCRLSTRTEAGLCWKPPMRETHRRAAPDAPTHREAREADMPELGSHEGTKARRRPRSALCGFVALCETCSCRLGRQR